MPTLKNLPTLATGVAVIAVAVVIRGLIRLARPTPVPTHLSTVVGCLAAAPAISAGSDRTKPEADGI